MAYPGSPAILFSTELGCCSNYRRLAGVRTTVNTSKFPGFQTFLLKGFCAKRELGRVFNGPAVIRLRPGLLYEPDIFLISRDQLDSLAENYFSGAPRFVVEVISHSGRNHDLKTKAAHYHEYGVQEYWAIDAGRGIVHQHLLSQHAGSYVVTQHESGRLHAQTIPGFWIDVEWLWQDPAIDRRSPGSKYLAIARASARRPSRRSRRLNS